MKAKKVFEAQNFERGQDPKQAMGIGLWKPFNDVLVSIGEFKDNGGILEKGRPIYNGLGSKVGEWVGYDSEKKEDLMTRHGGIGPFVINPNYGVKIKAQVIYK